MSGALDQLPDSTAMGRISQTAQASCDTSAQAHAGLGADQPGSALAPAAGAFASVRASATIDLGGLGDALGSTLRTVTGAVPPAVTEHVGALDAAYQQAHALVARNPILSLLPEGSALQDVVAQIIDQTVALFERRVNELANRLLDAEEVAELVEAFEVMRRLATDFQAHADDLPGFVTSTLLGFSPQLLGPVRAHVATTDQVVVSLDPAALAAAVDPLRAAATDVVTALTQAVDDLDPTAAAGYTAIVAALDTGRAAVTTATDTLRPLYQGLDQVLGAHPWDTLIDGYLRLLPAQELRPRDLVDDVLTATVDLFDDLIAALQQAITAGDLASRVEQFGAGLHQAISGSGIGVVRQRILDFLDEIRATVASVPFAQAHQAVADMLGRVGQEISDLGLDQLATQIAAGLADLTTTATTATAQAGQAVRQGLQELLAAIDDLPAADLLAALQDAVRQLSQVVDHLHDGAVGAIEDLQAQLASLEKLSFRPVSDEVIGEIEDVRTRLREMNPDALSEEGKLAVRAALAVLEAVDVEGKVVTVLTHAFHDLQGQVLAVLDDITAALERIRGSVGELSPTTVLTPLTGALTDLGTSLDRLNAAALTTPLRTELDQLDQWLAGLNPAALLTPLQGPYDAALAAVRQLDPAVWGSTLTNLYAELAATVARLDLTPLFQELDQRRRDLLVSVRDQLSLAVHDLGLPEPLAGWLERVWPLLEGITDVLTLDPAAGMRQLSRRVHDGFTPAALYEPLEQVFDQAVATLSAVPAADLVAAATAARDDVLAALDELDPRRLVERLRAAHRRLVDVAPTTLVPPLTGVRALRIAFHAKADAALTTPAGKVAEVDASFDAVLQLLDGGAAASAVATLNGLHEKAMTALTHAVDNLDITQAAAAFDRLKATVDGLVPANLPRTGTLTVPQVIAACETWRPSGRAATLDTRLHAFLDLLVPVADQLEAAFDTFAADLRATAALIDPLALDQAVAEIFEAVRAQVEELDPADLLDQLRADVYVPVIAAVEGLNPAALAGQLDGAYQAARTAVTGELGRLVADVHKALEDHLNAARAAVKAVIGELTAALHTGAADLEDIIARIGDLVFVGLIQRLRTVLGNLATSFETELGRVRQSFDSMLDAIPAGDRIHPRTQAVAS
ncbi:hypothetical protein SAMN05421678_12912 [Actinopolymorpha cephalotaxi]|uniref:Uncharacterized protein n=1 Tax=Actinopolymorpha cephalotaxi TaxID=504797 RepID=A0A1I3C4A8_9ACTN|nr:hypothetical protein [Actinopolymorpha cephalotaxi]NYH85401.1 hypothetical protein [Actinopolymorpha cephalotaxi]SFH69367.1 hypothetical protein SAMN05421678_12912 [Actinopolymorpha cephalotaxi]